MIGLVMANAPAKPLVAAGLPRLVHVSDTVEDAPALKLTLLELVTTLNPLTLIERMPDVNPLTLIERMPDACAPTLGVVTWLILI